MQRKFLAAIVLVIMTVAALGVYYYETYVPGSVFIELYRSIGPNLPPQCAGGANTTLSLVRMNITRIQVHSAGQSNSTGWHPIQETPENFTPGVIFFFGVRSPSGDYDLLGFNITRVTFTVENVGNISQTVAGGGFETAASFHVWPNHTTIIDVESSFIDKGCNQPIQVYSYSEVSS